MACRAREWNEYMKTVGAFQVYLLKKIKLVQVLQVSGKILTVYKN